MPNDTDLANRKVKDAWVAQLSKSHKSTVTMEDDKAEAVAQKPLGALSYRGRSFTLWAMTDPGGGNASGGNPQSKDLAKMNQYGTLAIQASTDLNGVEADWRRKVDVVRKAATQSALDIKKVDARLPAMRERRSKDRAVFADVHAFTDALKKAEGIVDRIRAAEAGLKQAASTLRKEELWQQADDQKDKVEEDKQKVADKQAEMDRAKAIAKGILDIADKVIHQEWTALASKALDYAVDKALDAAVDSVFGEDLAKLQSELAKAQADLKKMQKDALTQAVEAARSGVEKSLDELQAAKNEFRGALEQVAQTQANAKDTLKKAPSTALLGTMLTQRSKQLADLDTARAACERYGRLSTVGRQRMTQVANNYGVVGSWLNSAAAANPTFDRSKPYAQILERSALGNSIEIGRWGDWTSGVQDDCKKALAWLNNTKSDAGPIAHFEHAIDVANNLQKDG